MKRPKKDGNRHLLTAFSTETIDLLISKLINETFEEGNACKLLLEKLCKNYEDNGLKQIAILKEAGDKLLASTRQLQTGRDVEIALESLSFLFIKCRAKHPARRAIASVIHGLPDSIKPSAISCLTENLSLELQGENNTHDGQDFHDIFRNKVETLMAFTENFPLGKSVIKKCFNQGLHFVLIGLQREIGSSRSCSSLDAQSTSMLNCLSALKAIIALLHSQPTEESHQHTSYPDPNIETLCDVLEYAINILQDSNFMLDCRSTAGIALVSTLQYLVPEEGLRLIAPLMLAKQNESSVLLEKVVEVFNEKKAKDKGIYTAVMRIISEKFGEQKEENRRFSKLIICHGFITKLDSGMLHGGGLSSADDHNVTKIQNDSHDMMSVGKNLVEKVSCLDIAETSKYDDDVLIGRPVVGSESRNNPRNSDPDATSDRSKRSIFISSILNCLLDTCATVNEKGMTVYAYRTLYSWTVEALGHCKRLLDSGSLNCDSVYSPQNDITPRLLFALNNYLDHPVDAVRHQVRNSLENVIRIINLFPDSELHIKTLLSSWLNGNLKSRSKCMSLVCILDHVSVQRLLEIRPYLSADLLDCLNDSNLASHICDLYVKCASKHKSEIDHSQCDIEPWVNVWCEPVFKALSSGDSLKRTYSTDYIVPGLLKAFPSLLHLILDRSRNLENCEDYIVTSIVFLSSARSLQECSKVKLSEQLKDDDYYWHGLVRMEYMELCILHIDEQVRLDCLSLICESNKSTEILIKQDFELLKLFIPLNMTSQSPKFRSRFVCCLKKAVSRIADRCKQIMKVMRLEIDPDDVDDKSSSHRDSYIIDCEAFLRWLLEFLLQCLHFDACFPRMLTALEIMSNVLKVISLNSASQNDAHTSTDKAANGPTKCLFFAVIKNVFTKEGIQSLVNCFYDSYDVNRSLATEILLILPRDIYTFEDEELVSLFEQAIGLMYSPQPDTANTAPHMLLFLANSGFKTDVSRAILNVYRNEESTKRSCVYNTHLIITNILTMKLNDQVELAGKQLSEAAHCAPLHGTLHSIRELLKTVKIKDVGDKDKWKILIEELVKLCLRVTNIAGPIIQNSAPEGSLDSTGDHNVMVSQLLNDREVEKTGVETQAYLSQMLLVCCWRSMKEAVLLLGDIVSSVPIFSDPPIAGPGAISAVKVTHDESIQQCQILPSSIAIEIGNVFIDILLSSRHIGAFELAYLGFVKVCDTFWKSDISDVKALPKKWISDLLKTLKSDDPSTVLCSTRRSAGIPFFISAICSTEPLINKRRSFKNVMNALIEICSTVQRGAEGRHGENTSQKVICLNILRSLFKDSKFGEDVFPYASDGLIIAIRGFSSNIWAIRNACTLLFSALLSRVFGVKKFPMSGTEFFSRFSPLHSFMKAEMEDVTNHFMHQSSHVHLHPSVFPLLMLLSHLYTSSMDGNDSKMTLTIFIPHIIRCGCSGVYKTRVMAARALASIITPGQLIETLNLLISSLPIGSEDKISQNKVNGCLLQIQMLLDAKITDNNVSPSLKEDIIHGPLVHLGKHLFIISSQEECSFNKATFIDIISNTVMCLKEEDWNSLTQNTKEMLLVIKRTCLNTIFDELGLTAAENGYDLSLQRKIGHEMLRKAALAFLKLAFDSSMLNNDLKADDFESYKASRMLMLLTSDFCDVRESVLNWMAAECRSEIEDASIVSLLQRRLLWDEDEAECLAEICNVLAKSSRSRNFPWVAGEKELLDCFQVWECLKLRLKEFGKRESLINGVQRLTLVFVSHLHAEIVKLNDDSKLKTLSEMFDMIKQSCQAEKSLLSRMEAAKAIGNSAYLQFFTDKEWIDSQNVDLVFKYWKCIIDLLQDEDVDIRSKTARSVFPFIKNVAAGNDIAFTHCSNLPSGYCIQPNYALQMLITSVTSYYSEFCDALCNFLMSLLIGKEEQNMMIFSENSLSDNLPGNRIQCNEKKMDHAVIFEQSEANTYKEDLTLGHIAFEELQNIILFQDVNGKVLNHGFSLFISQIIKEWTEEPSRFFENFQIKTSCQVLMALCILSSLNKEGNFSNVLEAFSKFYKNLVKTAFARSVAPNYTLKSHLTSTCWACGL